MPTFKTLGLFKKSTFFFILILVINLFVIASSSFEMSRFIRMLSVSIFFLYFIFKRQSKNFWMYIVLGLFLAKDIAIQFYEISWGYKAYLFLGTLAYLFLILERLPKLKKIQVNLSILIITSVLIAANTYSLYVIMDMLSYEFSDSLEVVLFYLYGAMMIMLGVAAISYFNKYNSKRSLFFCFLAFGFILADIASLFAYYFDYEAFFYPDRALYILGVGLLVNYGLNFESAREEYYQYNMIQNQI